MGAHCANPHTDAVDGNRVIGAPENFVGLDSRLPLFLTHAVVELLVDERDKTAGQGHLEVLGREAVRTHGFGYLAVNLQNRGGRIVQLRLDALVELAHLVQQLAHVLSARTGSRLISHGRHPLDQILFKQATQSQHHKAHGAVTTDVVLDAFLKRSINHVSVDRIQNNHRVVDHPQGGGCINPVTFPARVTELLINRTGVVATLTGHDDIHGFQNLDVKRVLQRRNVVFSHVRRRLASLGCGEKHRFDIGEIVFFTHALHEDRAHHATPTYKSNSLHVRSSDLVLCPPHAFIAGRDRMGDPAATASRCRRVSNTPVRAWPLYSAARTASPISRVDTFFAPSDMMSAVRRP